MDGQKAWREKCVKSNRKCIGLSGELAFFYGKHHSEESKKLISEARRANWRNEDYRKKMMEIASQRSMVGENNPMFGRIQSAETRKKISDQLKGKPLSEANIIRLQNLHKKTRKSVLKLSLDGDVVCKYDSMFIAADDVNGNSQNIGFACRHYDRTYKGYYWRYCDDDNG